MTNRTPTSRSRPGGPARLAHRRVVDRGAHPDRWVFFLHGFLGAGRNWASIARGLVSRRPDWGAVLVDLRLHGDSTGLAPPHTVAACAADVNELTLAVGGTEVVLVGHSFGGKVALAATRSPAEGLRQVWVLDSTPQPGRTDAGADRRLTLLARLPSRFDDRREAVDSIREAGFGEPIAEWAVTNLVRAGGGYRWRLDFTALELLLADFYREDLWAVVDGPPNEVELIFVRATHATILGDDAAKRIQRLESDGSPVHLVDLAGGHWLNMTNPEGLLDILVGGLPA